MKDRKFQSLRFFAPALGLLSLVLATLIVFNQLHASPEASNVIAAQPTGTTNVRATLVAATQTAAAVDRIARWTPPPPPTLRPLPTATFLPDRGVHALPPQELPIQSRLSFFPTSADAKTIVGIARTDGRNAITAIDLLSSQARVLSEELGDSPRVSGKYVVWTKPPGLYLYDMEQGRTRSIESGAARDARISGTIIVWDRYEAGKDAQPGIWGYDLIKGRDFPVATQPELIEEVPEISGDWVVYRGKTGQPPMGELRVANVRTGENIYLGQIFTGSRYMPAIPNLYAIDIPWIAWGVGTLEPEPTLHLYNVETRQTRTVPVPGCVHPLSQRKGGVQAVRISQGVVIFQCHAYMGYHIRRNVFFTIPVQQPKTEDDALMGWVIANDQIIWLWHANVNGQGESRVYRSQIIVSPEPPPYP